MSALLDALGAIALMFAPALLLLGGCWLAYGPPGAASETSGYHHPEFGTCMGPRPPRGGAR